ELSQHCYSVNNAMQLFHFGIRNTHEMQVDHILGLCDRFSSVTDTILSNASQCPDALYRRIAHFGVATRIRAKELLLREKRKQRKER
ncbi:MAG: hypothetical protein KC680_02675, partial [Candidatus Peregrinibacteria bacterium]|nr:hypothetical protein [Candidatus Peregrinibacteria bacterium]